MNPSLTPPAFPLSAWPKSSLHLPRIYGQYRKLLRYTRAHQAHRRDPHRQSRFPSAPGAASEKNARARLLFGGAASLGLAPRPRENHPTAGDKLFCLFPFEEPWFRERGVDATYIGHPLASMVRTSSSAELSAPAMDCRTKAYCYTLLPGSRPGEAVRHMPVLWMR